LTPKNNYGIIKYEVREREAEKLKPPVDQKVL